MVREPDAAGKDQHFIPEAVQGRDGQEASQNGETSMNYKEWRVSPEATEAYENGTFGLAAFMAGEASGRAENMPSDDFDMPLDQAIRLAGLWRSGKMIGGDSHACCVALLSGMEKMMAALAATVLIGVSHD